MDGRLTFPLPLAIPPDRGYLSLMNTTPRPSDSSFARFAAAAMSHARLGGLLLLALSGDRRAR